MGGGGRILFLPWRHLPIVARQPSTRIRSSRLSTAIVALRELLHLRRYLTNGARQEDLFGLAVATCNFDAIRPWLSERQIGEAGGGIVVNGGHARAQASIRPAGNGSHTASARTFAKGEARRGLTSAGKQAVSDAFEAQQVA